MGFWVIKLNQFKCGCEVLKHNITVCICVHQSPYQYEKLVIHCLNWIFLWGISSSSLELQFIMSSPILVSRNWFETELGSVLFRDPFLSDIEIKEIVLENIGFCFLFKSMLWFWISEPYWIKKWTVKESVINRSRETNFSFNWSWK